MSISPVIFDAPALGGTPADSIASGALNFTGVDLITACLGWFPPGVTPGLTDDQGNAYNYLSSYSDGANTIFKIAYKINPIVSATMVFTLAGVGAFPVLALGGFSGAIGGHDVGKEAGNATAAANITTGPCGTPTQNNSLIVTGIQVASASAVFALNNVPNPFTIGAQHIGNGSNGNSIAIAYEIQTNALDRDADWVNNFSAAAGIAVFLPTSGVTSVRPFAFSVDAKRIRV